jgi:hypothetical protein
MAANACSQLWCLLLGVALPNEVQPTHLLWALLFLKVHAAESVLCCLRECDQKTPQKWVWAVLGHMSTIGALVSVCQLVIESASRSPTTQLFILFFEGGVGEQEAVSKRLNAFGDSWRCWLPHLLTLSLWLKVVFFEGPGAWCEIGVCIQTGWTVWANGPFPCGEWPDLRMARGWLVCKLERWEKRLADGGCADESGFSETPNGLNNQDQRMKADARASPRCGKMKRTLTCVHGHFFLPQPFHQIPRR